ncbi:hypothetical protein Tco_1025316 [Tanacetum coccineum]
MMNTKCNNSKGDINVEAKSSSSGSCGELDLEAKGSYVTRRGHVGGLEGDEEGLEDVLFKLESSLDVLAWSWYVAAKKEEQGTM